MTATALLVPAWIIGCTHVSLVSLTTGDIRYDRDFIGYTLELQVEPSQRTTFLLTSTLGVLEIETQPRTK